MYKNGERSCYEIYTYPNRYANLYQYSGEPREYNKKAYGQVKYKNGDEYEGTWLGYDRHGEGIFKEASTGKIQRLLYEEDKVVKVLEENIESLD